MKKILKIFFLSVFIILLSLYLVLNLYISSKTIKVDVNLLKQKTNIQLSGEQIKIACCIFTNKIEPDFKKLPLFIDAFSKRNFVAHQTAQLYFEHFNSRNRKIKTMEWRFIILATSRYIVRKIDYRDCYNYLFSYFYFGNNITNIENASLNFFNKKYHELTAEEFKNLCLKTLKPI